ncbi:MAG: hypothetical protein K9M07_05860 [Simkaniaceae bacterium]|nr:hypothetical protein [Simkaniaceae bacterium]
MNLFAYLKRSPLSMEGIFLNGRRIIWELLKKGLFCNNPCIPGVIQELEFLEAGYSAGRSG